MNFTPQFRKISDDVSPRGIREWDTAPLILIKADGTATYANSRGGKDQLVDSFVEGEDLLLWPWPGQWRTDIFMLTRADLDKHYREKPLDRSPAI